MKREQGGWKVEVDCQLIREINGGFVWVRFIGAGDY